jgi:biotin carboxyl carrier protein
MTRKYKLRIDDNTFEVEIDGPDNETLHITIGETIFPVQITDSDRTKGRYKITVGETEHLIQITPTSSPSQYSVHLNKQTFAAALQPVSTKPSQPSRSYSPTSTPIVSEEISVTTPGIVKSAEPGTVSAPLPGRVLEVRVKLNQQILAGDVLLVLEAMKMANEIRAPHDGIVSTVHVENGTAVEKGQALVTIR